jgi:isopentenyl-diphosphate delta-isomerase
VRDIAPNVLLLGNIGAAQLSEYSQEQIENLALTVGANVLAVHLNSIQEKIQPEGNLPDIDYSEKVKQLCSSVKLPVILKETGMGISSKDAHSFRESGIAGIDVGGAGGTSFARVELERGGNGEFHNLENSGIPTAASILEVRKVFPNIPIIATGGIRTGFDVAKSIALGADVAGIALPLLKPAQESTEAVVGKLEKIIEDLKKAMISSNSPTVSDLKADKININGELLEWVENLKN